MSYYLPFNQIAAQRKADADAYSVECNPNNPVVRAEIKRTPGTKPNIRFISPAAMDKLNDARGFDKNYVNQQNFSGLPPAEMVAAAWAGQL